MKIIPLIRHDMCPDRETSYARIKKGKYETRVVAYSCTYTQIVSMTF
jgi:hypothetical protein